MNDYLLSGKILKTHKLDGLLKVESYLTDNNLFLSDIVIINAKDKSDQHKIKTITQMPKNRIIIEIDKINTINEAEKLLGGEIFCKKSILPEGNYCYELIGMQIIQNGKIYSHIKEIYNFGAGDIIEAQDGKMIPFNDIAIEKVDEDKVYLKDEYEVI